MPSALRFSRLLGFPLAVFSFVVVFPFVSCFFGSGSVRSLHLSFNNLRGMLGIVYRILMAFLFFCVFSSVEVIESIEPIDQPTNRSNRSKAALVLVASAPIYLEACPCPRI